MSGRDESTLPGNRDRDKSRALRSLQARMQRVQQARNNAAQFRESSCYAMRFADWKQCVAQTLGMDVRDVQVLPIDATYTIQDHRLAAMRIENQDMIDNHAITIPFDERDRLTHVLDAFVNEMPEQTVFVENGHAIYYG